MQVILVPDSGNGNNRKLMQMTFEESSILIKAEDKSEYRIPVNQLTVSVGGNNERLVFLRAPILAGNTAYFEMNSDILRKLKSYPQLYKVFSPAVKVRKGNQRVLLITLSLILVLFSLFIFNRRSIFGSLSFLIPFKVEKKIGDKLFNPLITIEQRKIIDEVNLVFHQLKFNPKVWDNEFTFHISSETIPNAYASLGGHIFINKGLIQLLNTTEDMIGVVAHEMIHVQQRHVAKSVIQALGMYTVFSLLVGDVTGLAGVLIDQGGPLLSLQYSRALEDEADDLGIDLLIQNQIDPSGLATSLSMIRDEQQKLMKQSPAADVLEKLSKIEVLNSHPNIDQRIEGIKNKIRKKTGDKKFKPIQFDYKKFQKSVKDSF